MVLNSRTQIPLHSRVKFSRIRELTPMSGACLPLGVLWAQTDISAIDRTPLALSGGLSKVMLMSAEYVSLFLVSIKFSFL